MNSEWQINRIGLLDFWYYDEQEFDFLDGRMLLRGANGSGKSVTMQSFIPLLLDGNMRPERLDPFGSRARKMENYLLEEGDEREERTGYLYMDLKRTDSDNYTTIGIGIRARKNKKLDTWYFCVTDGRRMGRDFSLYKDSHSRITCTRQELRNRLGEGGRVMETQGEYAQCVNRLLFGFETMDEYQEMLDLLIQLRTPKLSKDFKPSVINEILSKSLQTLSEDDLRPMSEAIENMDSQKTNLDTLDESIRAAEQIGRSFDQYNQIVLYDKALLFTNCAQECKKQEKQIKELVRQRGESSQRLEEEKARYDTLRREEEVLKQEESSLRDSDAAKLKQQEIGLLDKKEEAEREAAEKKKQEQEKEDRYREIQGKQKKQKQQNELLWEEIEGCLGEMEEALEDIPFDDFAFLKKELLADPGKEQAFQSHSKLLAEYVRKVQAGRDVLFEEKNCQERYDLRLREMDSLRGQQEQKERELRQYETLLQEIKDEWLERFYQWMTEYKAEEKAGIFYRAGLLRDELSNHALAYGIRGMGKDGKSHKGIDGYLEQREPVHLTLMTLGKLAQVRPQAGERVYIVENPAVFALLAKAWPERAILCGNGQIRLATLVLLDLFDKDIEFWYGGDYDPEGLLIAQRLKERYKERLHFWKYRREFYEKYCSDVKIGEKSLKKLERIYRQELSEVRLAMERLGKAAYQEAMLEEYLKD